MMMLYKDDILEVFEICLSYTCLLSMGLLFFTIHLVSLSLFQTNSLIVALLF